MSARISEFLAESGAEPPDPSGRFAVELEMLLLDAGLDVAEIDERLKEGECP